LVIRPTTWGFEYRLRVGTPGSFYAGAVELDDGVCVQTKMRQTTRVAQGDNLSPLLLRQIATRRTKKRLAFASISRVWNQSRDTAISLFNIKIRPMVVDGIEVMWEKFGEEALRGVRQPEGRIPERGHEGPPVGKE